MFSLWRKARRENSAASRLLGSTSLRFALHGWQRLKPFFDEEEYSAGEQLVQGNCAVRHGIRHNTGPHRETGQQ
ncbi:hypothetical protein [Thiolapillus sp.]|uniref:hypothetical protein n=2 Tax=Thiolapillus sp. TaxID=2017437 RepID=UPI003AF7CE0F